MDGQMDEQINRQTTDLIGCCPANAKYPTKDQHKYDHVYYSKCPEPIYNEDYLVKTGRIIERSADHCDKDKQSHLLRHLLNNNHKTVDLKDFKIIDSSYHNNRFKRKISEALYIKQYKPSQNTQEQSAKNGTFQLNFYVNTRHIAKS